MVHYFNIIHVKFMIIAFVSYVSMIRPFFCKVFTLLVFHSANTDPRCESPLATEDIPAAIMSSDVGQREAVSFSLVCIENMELLFGCSINVIKLDNISF